MCVAYVRIVDIWLSVFVVCCMGFIVLLIFDWVLHGFIVLLMFDCVVHGFYRFVDCSLYIAWVLSFCGYLIVYCMGFNVLWVFYCVLQWFYRFVVI